MCIYIYIYIYIIEPMLYQAGARRPLRVHRARAGPRLRRLRLRRGARDPVSLYNIILFYFEKLSFQFDVFIYTFMTYIWQIFNTFRHQVLSVEPAMQREYTESRPPAGLQRVPRRVLGREIIRYVVLIRGGNNISWHSAPGAGNRVRGGSYM